MGVIKPSLTLETTLYVLFSWEKGSLIVQTGRKDIVLQIQSNLLRKTSQQKSRIWPVSTGDCYTEGGLFDFYNHCRLLKYWFNFKGWPIWEDGVKHSFDCNFILPLCNQRKYINSRVNNLQNSYIFVVAVCLNRGLLQQLAKNNNFQWTHLDSSPSRSFW